MPPSAGIVCLPSSLCRHSVRAHRGSLNRFESVCFTLSIASNNHPSTPKCKICFRLWSDGRGEFTVVELFEQRRARTRTHRLILIKVLSFARLQLCYKNRGPLGLRDSLKLDQNVKNTICQESTGTRISPVKLSVVLSETRCPAQTTSVNFDTVFYNLVGCKYWCCSASSEFKKTKNKKTFGCLTVNPPFCPPEGDCFIRRSGAFGVLSVVCKYQDLLCQIQTKQIFFCRINEALEMLKCLFASISLPS